MSDPELRDPRLDDAYGETPRDEPSPAADEHIRAAARRAVDARPTPLVPQDSRRSFARWRVPLSLAATVVLAVTVALMVDEEDGRPRDDNSVPLASPPQAEPPDTSSERDAGVRSSGDTVAPQKPAEAKRSTAPPRNDIAPPAAPPPQPLREERRRLPDSPAAGAPAEAARTPAPAAAPPAADSAAPMRKERPASARPDRAEREAASAVAPARSPEEWIDEIRRLKAHGLDAEAAAEVAEFRRRYPNYVLPAELLP